MGMLNQIVLPWEYVGSANKNRDTEHLARLEVPGGWLYKIIAMNGSTSITFVPRVEHICHELYQPTENVLDADVPM
jgi:hypothetical protein